SDESDVWEEVDGSAEWEDEENDNLVGDMNNMVIDGVESDEESCSQVLICLTLFCDQQPQQNQLHGNLTMLNYHKSSHLLLSKVTVLQQNQPAQGQMSQLELQHHAIPQTQVKSTSVQSFPQLKFAKEIVTMERPGSMSVSSRPLANLVAVDNQIRLMVYSSKVVIGCLNEEV
ncbi:hypothetical protein Tco_0994562, partial [Tanacetum coccineum]